MPVFDRCYGEGGPIIVVLARETIERPSSGFSANGGRRKPYRR